MGLDPKPDTVSEKSDRLELTRVGMLLLARSIKLDLSRIPAQPKPGLLNVLIEITAGSKNKYEYDKDMQVRFVIV